VSYPDERFASVYASLLASLRGGGRPIATMDMLIATAAVVDDAAIVTRNGKHFSRVPGLQIRAY
jgi:predicted nucleic acid-binding protein